MAPVRIICEPIEFAVPLEVLSEAIRPNLGLHGCDAGSDGDVEKVIGHLM